MMFFLHFIALLWHKITKPILKIKQILGYCETAVLSGSFLYVIGEANQLFLFYVRNLAAAQIQSDDAEKVKR